jgi:oxygen-independent coproporphyrinogen-3 oxidase
MHQPWAMQPMGLYIHIPFCRRRCYYCDFPIVVAGESKNRQAQMSGEYTQLLKKEIFAFSQAIDSIKESFIIDSVYLGGGTPSLALDEDLRDILNTIRAEFNVLGNAEISLEADPGTFSYKRLVMWKNIGFNRLSVGIQSFDDEILQRSGRAHNSMDAYRAINDINKASFDRYSLDLISSLPLSTRANWERSLKSAAQSGAPHISVYDLQIGEKTAFASWYSPGVFPLPTNEESVAMYTIAQEVLGSMGYEHYEVSSYAKSGYRSHHNQKYWQCVPTLAFGLGASSHLGGNRFSRPSKMTAYKEWVQNISRNPLALISNLLEAPDKVQNLNSSLMLDEWKPVVKKLASRPVPDLLEYVMLQLRTRDGLHLQLLSEIYGPTITKKLCSSIVHMLGRTVVYGDENKNSIRLTDPEGFIVSNDIISTIFAALDDNI